MTVRALVDCFDASQWRNWTRQFADHNLYQTWGYGQQSAADTRCRLSRYVLLEGDEPLGMAQLRIKRIPLVGAGLAYCFFGPIFRKKESQGAGNFSKLLAGLRNEYIELRGLVLRIVPNVARDDAEAMHALNAAEFVSDEGVAPQRTFLLNLSPPLEQLRANLDQKWRNGLNQSERKGIRVRICNDDDSMACFESLYENMWAHKRFETGVNVASFRELQKKLDGDEKQTVMLADLDGVPVAGHVSSALGNTCVYLLGASNDAGRSSKASYSLQWKTIEYAKVTGATWYDLGGIDPVENPGVYHFKAGLGGVDTTYVGQFSASPKGSAAALLPIAEKAYRTMNRVKRRFAGGAHSPTS